MNNSDIMEETLLTIIQFMKVYDHQYQDLTQRMATLSAQVEELETFKKSIEKLPYYADWVAAYNCDGYHE